MAALKQMGCDHDRGDKDFSIGKHWTRMIEYEYPWHERTADHGKFRILLRPTWAQRQANTLHPDISFSWARILELFVCACLKTWSKVFFHHISQSWRKKKTCVVLVGFRNDGIPLKFDSLCSTARSQVWARSKVDWREKPWICDGSRQSADNGEWYPVRWRRFHALPPRVILPLTFWLTTPYGRPSYDRCIGQAWNWVSRVPKVVREAMACENECTYQNYINRDRYQFEASRSLLLLQQALWLY